MTQGLATASPFAANLPNADLVNLPMSAEFKGWNLKRGLDAMKPSLVLTGSYQFTAPHPRQG
jgi:hypothetical protein